MHTRRNPHSTPEIIIGTIVLARARARTHTHTNTHTQSNYVESYSLWLSRIKQVESFQRILVCWCFTPSQPLGVTSELGECKQT